MTFEFWTVSRARIWSQLALALFAKDFRGFGIHGVILTRLCARLFKRTLAPLWLPNKRLALFVDGQFAKPNLIKLNALIILKVV